MMSKLHRRPSPRAFWNVFSGPRDVMRTFSVHLVLYGLSCAMSMVRVLLWLRATAPPALP